MRIRSSLRAGRPSPARREARIHPAAWLLATACLAATACDSSTAVPLSDTERAVHLLSRTTYGVRPADVSSLLEMGADAWLERQLRPERIDDSALAARLEDEGGRDDPRSILMLATPPTPPDSTMTPVERRRRSIERVRVRALLVARDPQMNRLVSSRMQRAVHSERQLEEVMTDFWFNHFNVQYAGRARAVIESYERDAIRPHVFGRFGDMLAATARHPAMMIYLDNYMSTAPTPDGGGLNENYARELLELHTLGVEGGYAQQDVIEVARAFTGWTVEDDPRDTAVAFGPRPRPRKTRFVFRPEHHDRDEKIVLGHVLPAGRGMEDGLDVLEMLAGHPSTAEHVASRLARHFVADDPPRRLVTHLAAVFLETGGDLREVSRALFTSEAFYDRAHYRAKAKRPFEFLASALRVTGAGVQQTLALQRHLATSGHLPYSAPEPTGYPTEATEWLSSAAIMARIDFALALANGNMPGIDLDPAAILADAAAPPGRRGTEAADEANAAAHRLARHVLQRLLPGHPADSLTSAVAGGLTGRYPGEPEALVAPALALVLGSPEFQWY